MIMNPTARKFALTAHITFSVGWLGAVAGFLVLALAGLYSQDNQMVRSAYITMDLIAWYVIVPASLLALLTGLIQSLGTKWGLFRHYWIIVKLFLTVGSTILLLLHMQLITKMAEVASHKILSSTDLRGLRIQLTADAAAAIFVLLITIALSVYKPWGQTGYGRKNKLQHEKSANNPGNLKASKTYIIIIGLIALLMLFIIMHLAGGGLHH